MYVYYVLVCVHTHTITITCITIVWICTVGYCPLLFVRFLNSSECTFSTHPLKNDGSEFALGYYHMQNVGLCLWSWAACIGTQTWTYTHIRTFASHSPSLLTPPHSVHSLTPHTSHSPHSSLHLTPHSLRFPYRSVFQ